MITELLFITMNLENKSLTNLPTNLPRNTQTKIKDKSEYTAIKAYAIFNITPRSQIRIIGNYKIDEDDIIHFFSIYIYGRMEI